MDEETKTSYEALLEICESHASALIALSIQMRSVQVELDTLRVMVHMLAKKCQFPAEDVVTLLSALRSAFEQWQLEVLEDRNPAAAARADTRQGIPNLDPEIMEMIRRACGEA